MKCYLDALDHQYALIRLDLTAEFGRPPDAISRAFPARLRTRVMRKRLAHVFGGAQAGITGAIGGRPLVEAKRMSSLKLILESFLVEPPPTGFI
jgi:hypothetical protein